MEQNQKFELFYKAQQGDGEAFGALFEQYWDVAYYSCLNRLKNAQDAEDATQEVFIVLHRRLSSVKDPAFLPRHIKWLAGEICGNHGKKRKGIPADKIIWLEDRADTLFESKDEFLPHVAVEHDEIKTQIMSLVETLPKKQVEVLFLRYYDQLSPKEIATTLRANEKTVYSRLDLARKTLKRLIEERMEKGEIAMPVVTILPVLTRVYMHDMQRRARPEIGRRIWSRVERRINSPALPEVKRPGGKGLGFQLAIGGVLTAAVAFAVIAGVNIYNQSRPIDTAAIDLQGNIYDDLKRIKTRADLEWFAGKWQFTEVVQSRVNGVTYIIYHKVVDEVRILAGGSENGETFTPAWGTADPNAALPTRLTMDN